MNVIMVWAWMLWSSDAVKHERYYGLGMDALVTGCSRTCEHERYHGLGMDAPFDLGMDALVIGCSRT